MLIADDGRIKLGDFGLARAISTSTSTGALIGTVAYLSPELVLGRPADARSDIYSVGIMLYEMLTGQQPFDGEVPIQVAYQHVNSAVGAPSELVPGLAAEIDELVQWCTANDPDKRPVDGTALLSELRHIRRNLSDAELDLQPPAARPAIPLIAGPCHTGDPAAISTTYPATAPPKSSEQASTPTEFIAGGNHPTTVMSASPRHPGYGPLSAPEEATYPEDNNPEPEPPVPGSKRAQRKQDRDEDRSRQRAAATPLRSLRAGNPRRRGLFWIVVLVLAALLAGGAGWFFGMGPGSPGTIPQLKNKTVAEAQQLLRTAGFQSTTRDVFDDDVAPGLVVGSAPTGGGSHPQVPAGFARRLQGRRAVPLPQLTGKSLDEAKTALNGAGMALGQITETLR